MTRTAKMTNLPSNQQNLEVPRVRLSISGVKSGTNPETPRKSSQSKFRISRFRTVGDPETLENKGDSLPRLISELCYSQYGWYPFLFWKGPLHGTARAGHEIPNSTGGTSTSEKQGLCCSDPVKTPKIDKNGGCHAGQRHGLPEAWLFVP